VADLELGSARRIGGCAIGHQGQRMKWAGGI
jgi:hypothetical protein